MAKKHANTLPESELYDLILAVSERAKDPRVLRVAFRLSYNAGLRVQEIAGLEWDRHIMRDGKFRCSSAVVYGENGRPRIVKKTGKVMTRLTPTLFVSSDIGKYGTERHIPLHPALQEDLKTLYAERDPAVPWVIPSRYKAANQSLTRRAHALKMRIKRMYDALGMEGFSSHSGRRSFITLGAQKANAFGNSLVDVQILAGHRSLTTTQHYIDVSPRHPDLVNNLFT